MPATERVTLPTGGGDPPPSLVLGRLHELCGPERRTLGLMLAGAVSGPVLWIASTAGSEKLHAPGMAAHLDPGRVTMVDCPRPEDVLWSAEESLRQLASATTGGVVVAELGKPPGLTPVRRLHLAAGGAAARAHGPGVAPPRGLPLGLLVTPGDGGAAGVESRWHMAACSGEVPGSDAWRLERRRARGAGPATWILQTCGSEPPLLRRVRSNRAP